MFNNINSFIYNARKMHLAFSLQVYKPQYIKVDFKKNLDVKEQFPLVKMNVQYMFIHVSPLPLGYR